MRAVIIPGLGSLNLLHIIGCIVAAVSLRPPYSNGRRSRLSVRTALVSHPVGCTDELSSFGVHDFDPMTDGWEHAVESHQLVCCLVDRFSTIFGTVTLEIENDAEERCEGVFESFPTCCHHFAEVRLAF
jgi:hypothetical protein